MVQYTLDECYNIGPPYRKGNCDPLLYTPPEIYPQIVNLCNPSIVNGNQKVGFVSEL